ncbi:uncharacterized protein LOC130891506 [Diorhabda carinulata]|uniref:uncharacterized protein LOC130891506 n=1 Tax=Diorhabda carinulata TaxID=1163345 RepID=UPI0025A127BC|nr:uncharacterized protein LOC130891506 [Diorhabda carinulata]
MAIGWLEDCWQIAVSELWELVIMGSNVEIKSNGIETGRSSNVGGIEDHIENYIKSHEVTFDLPIIGSKVTLEGRNLDNDEMNMKLKFGTDIEARKKKRKLKKLFIPILIFVVIKALTLIPLALGILGIKAWNASQLSFISFISSIAIAIWKLCTKVGPEPPQIIHQAYDPHLHHYHLDRSDNAQQMAYAGYAQQQ